MLPGYSWTWISLDCTESRGVGLVNAFDEHHAKEHGFDLGQSCCVVKYATIVVMLEETVGECGGAWGR